jgi:hypothetical protein
MGQKIGVVIALGVFAVVGILLFMNVQTGGSSSPSPSAGSLPMSPDTDVTQADSAKSGGAPFREYPIGETEQNGMQIAAVWLPPVQMEGMDLPQDADVIHLEADIHGLEGNVHGFGRGAWIPYLTVRYEIIPVDTDKEPIRDVFMPMVANDGPHYGATIHMPGPGKYRLIYKLEPPSSNGFGRHSDPITGVAPWWEPFQVGFEFKYSGPPKPSGSQ